MSGIKYTTVTLLHQQSATRYQAPCSYQGFSWTARAKKPRRQHLIRSRAATPSQTPHVHCTHWNDMLRPSLNAVTRTRSDALQYKQCINGSSAYEGAIFCPPVPRVGMLQVRSEDSPCATQQQRFLTWRYCRNKPASFTYFFARITCTPVNSSLANRPWPDFPTGHTFLPSDWKYITSCRSTTNRADRPACAFFSACLRTGARSCTP